ncbi:MAG: hypothetical protein J6S73_04235, partial [Lentisphaeria bacterium]|nr:hypothetical protein [Lentisphaeria bacterium]
MLKYLLPSAALCLSASAAPLPLAPDAKGFPQGWQKYGRGPGIAKVQKGILRIADQSDVNEWGVSHTVTVTKPGKYECVVETAGNASSAQLVLNTGKISVCRFHSTPAGQYTPHYLGVEI